MYGVVGYDELGFRSGMPTLGTRPSQDMQGCVRTELVIKLHVVLFKLNRGCSGWWGWRLARGCPGLGQDHEAICQARQHQRHPHPASLLDWRA
eukprot:COSAG03_NODE_8380_length_808_cov_0.902680_1_plen_93_part_00